MTRTRQWWFRALAMAALAGTGACGGTEGASNVPACFPGALLHAQLSPNVATMSQPTFSLCRNDVACYAWTPAPLPKTGSGGDSEYVAVPAVSPFSILATLWRNKDGSVTLDVEWRTADASLLANGDHYVVTLADGAGTPVPIFDKTAVYESATSDNGAVCLEAKLSA